MTAHFIFCFFDDDGPLLALGLAGVAGWRAGVAGWGDGKVGRAHTAGLFDFRTLFT